MVMFDMPAMGGHFRGSFGEFKCYCEMLMQTGGASNKTVVLVGSPGTDHFSSQRLYDSMMERLAADGYSETDVKVSELKTPGKYANLLNLLKKTRNYAILLEIGFIGWIGKEPLVLVCYLSFKTRASLPAYPRVLTCTMQNYLMNLDKKTFKFASEEKFLPTDDRYI